MINKTVTTYVMYHNLAYNRQNRKSNINFLNIVMFTAKDDDYKKFFF